MSTKQLYQTVLNKVYRNQDIEINEIKLLLENPIDIVSKVELVMDDKQLKYKITYENSMSKNIGNVM